MTRDPGAGDAGGGRGRGTSRRPALWGIVGIALGLGPLALFAVAAAANLGGPLISVVVFALPVIGTTVLAVFVIRHLLAAREIAWGYSAAAVTIFAGIIGYVLWLFLALLALQFGNAPT